MVPSLEGLAPFQLAFVAACYDTADALGFLVEAVEPPVRMPPVDFA